MAVDIASAVAVQAGPFGLVLARLAGLVAALPAFGRQPVPPQVRAALALVVALLLLPVVPPPPAGALASAGAFVLAAAGELALGLGLGFAVSLAFAAVQTAGQMIDFQAGFTLAQVYDPVLGSPLPALSRLLDLLVLLIFFLGDVHHQVLLALARSFQAVPPGGVLAAAAGASVLAERFGAMFAAAAQLALPLAGTLLVVTVALGLLERAMPQLSLFSVGFPLQVAAALFALGLTLPALPALLDGLFRQTGELIRLLLEVVVP